MGTYTTGYDRKYKCINCGKVFLDSYEIDHKRWRCPCCDGVLHIAAPELAYGHTMVRILAIELKKYDKIHIPFTSELNEILDVKETENGLIRAAIKGYGVKLYEKTDFINTIIGGYFEEHWEDESKGDI